MRIISGKYGGRRIHPPTNMPYTRPTTDIAKEGLFNILHTRVSIKDANTLDLFGGTGCISYELASRGATHLTIVEKDGAMADFIKKNVDMLKIENVQLLRMDVFQFLNTCRRLIAPEGFFVLEHTPRNNYEKFEGFQFSRNYGSTIFSFFQCIE